MKNKYEFINEDKRVITRNLRRHQANRAELQKLYKSLPDDQEKGEAQIVYQEKEPDSNDAA